MQQRNGKRTKSIPAKQNGIALLMLMLAILLIVTVGLINIVNPEAKRIRMEQRTQGSLARAKEALIAYAVTSYDTNPGGFARLPCPDFGIDLNNSREGVQGPGCGANNVNVIGRLPWMTLGIDPLKDDSGECLWYSVSGFYKTNNLYPLLNEDSPGGLLLYESDGNTLITLGTPDTRIVAAVFAPGSPLQAQGQNRVSDLDTECGGDYNVIDFLDSVGSVDYANFGDVSFGIDEIAHGDASSRDVINDGVITISRREIWDAIRNRDYLNLSTGGRALYPADIFQEFTRELANCIATYGLNRGGVDLRLPWAVPADAVAQANWFYNDEANYQDQTEVFGGRFPFSIPVSSATLGGGSNIFVEAGCTAFVDLTEPPASLPSHPTFPLYRNLWRNWKDHVFYAVAEARAPSSASVSQSCGAAPYRCLNVNGYDYAAIVMFAGSPLNTPVCNPPVLEQSRDAPPDSDAKALTCNYLEGGNDVTLDGEDGDGNYQYQLGNDIMVCICENLDCNPLTPEIDIDTDCDPLTAL